MKKQETQQAQAPATAQETLPPGGGSWLRLPDGSLVPNNDAATAADKNEE
jgi:hypothetical protein